MITSFNDPNYCYFVNYTDDAEFFILTSNTGNEEAEWETCVYANNPQTNERDFESLVEHVFSKTDELAKLTHKNLHRKWNGLGMDKPIFLNEEDDYQIGEGYY